MNPRIHPLYINGTWREGSDGGVADDVNPATGEVFARIAQAGVQDVEDALAAAHCRASAMGKAARQRARNPVIGHRRAHRPARG